MKRATLLLSSAYLLSACGEAPQPVVPQAPAPNEHSPGDGHDHGPAPSREMPQDDIHAPFQNAAPSAPAGGMENPHVPNPAAEGAPFSGVVRLTGDRATANEGYLFVSIVPAGTNMPVCFDRLTLSDPEVGKLEGDQRVVPIAWASCPLPEGELELKVQYDLDGYVETKTEADLVGRFPVARGDEAIDVVLE